VEQRQPDAAPTWAFDKWMGNVCFVEGSAKEAQSLLLHIRAHNSSPFYTRRQRSLLREADFSHSEASMLPMYQTWAETNEETRGWTATMTRWFTEQAFVRTAHGQGWADQDTLDAIVAKLHA